MTKERNEKTTKQRKNKKVELLEIFISIIFSRETGLKHFHSLASVCFFLFPYPTQWPYFLKTCFLQEQKKKKEKKNFLGRNKNSNFFLFCVYIRAIIPYSRINREKLSQLFGFRFRCFFFFLELFSFCKFIFILHTLTPFPFSCIFFCNRVTVKST